MKRYYIFILSFFVLETILGQNTNPKFSPTPTDSITLYDTLSPRMRQRVNMLRNASYFSETISNYIPLSKVSGWINKRWTGDAFTDRKNFIMDAYVNVYVHASSDKWIISGKKNQLLFSLYFNPNFEVRIFRNDFNKGDKSEPVRTPSFRPGGELFITSSKFFSRERKNNFAISYKGYHHSNGQDGDAINRVNRLWGKAGYFNTYDGNFFENWRSELNLNFYTRSKSNKFFHHAKFGYSVAHSVEANLDYYKMYGTESINFFNTGVYAPLCHFEIRRDDGGWQPITKDYNIERFRWEFFFSVITNKMNTGPINNLKSAGIAERLNTHLTLHLRIPKFAEAGFFVEGGYYGRDTYNIYFQRSAWFAKLGLSFGKFIFYRRSDDLR